MQYLILRPLLAVSAVSLLAACGDGGAKVAERPANAPAAAPAVPADPSAPAFVQTAVSTDIFEIDASRVALERSQNYDVKVFAQKVIDARSKAGGELRQALNETGLPINPVTSLPAEAAQTVAALRAASPAEFDKLYMDAQVDSQANALAKLEKYAEEGATPALKAFAGKKAPEVREQHQAAQQLLNRLG